MKKLVSSKERDFYSNAIANYCVSAGSLKTTECNWYFDIKELEDYFNVEIDSGLLESIQEVIYTYPIVLDCDIDEVEKSIQILFSTYTYYNYETYLDNLSEEERDNELDESEGK